MNVASVQKHFRDLAAMLADTRGATTVVAELSAVADGLAPFRTQSLAEFAAFLRRAEEYQRLGKLEPLPTPRAGRKTTTTAVPPQEVIRRVGALYERVTDPKLTTEVIDAELALVDQLKVADLHTLAEAIGNLGVVKGLKQKADKASAIKKFIRDRRGMANRPNY